MAFHNIAISFKKIKNIDELADITAKMEEGVKILLDIDKILRVAEVAALEKAS